MRTWRKLESSIVTSDRLARISDSAKWLFTLLVVAQDDEGKYPWTKPRIHALTGTTDWDSNVCESLLSELRERGIADLRDGFVYLTNGAEKNGIPANSKAYPLLYPPISALGTESLASRELIVSDSHPQARIRVDKSRVDKIKMQKRAKPALRQLSVQELLDLFDENENLVITQRFPGIDLAWVAGKCVEWHNARGGSGNWKLAFKNWLDNEKGNTNGTSRQNAQKAGARFDNSDLKYLKAALSDMPPPSLERRAALLKQIAEIENGKVTVRGAPPRVELPR